MSNEKMCTAYTHAVQWHQMFSKKGGKMQDFGTKLLALLAKKNMTQNELAKKAGVGPAAISRYINGTVNPRGTSIMKIAEVLGVPFDFFLEDSPQSSPDYVKEIIEKNKSHMETKDKIEIVEMLLDRVVKKELIKEQTENMTDSERVSAVKLLLGKGYISKDERLKIIGMLLDRSR